MGDGALITEIIHPFARSGAGNTTGAIYGSTVSTTASSVTQIAVEQVTLRLPSQVVITELEYGLTLGLAISVTTDSPKVFFYAGDSPLTTTTVTSGAPATADTLAALSSTQTLSVVSTTTLVDMTIMGRMTPTTGTYLTGHGSFDVACYIASNATTSLARAAVKQSSYIQYSYYLLG